MRLENFEIHSSIALQTGNVFWDLHNFADFVGLELIPTENMAVMRWSAPAESNPWGCYENKFSGMTLRFKDLQLLHLGARDRDLPLLMAGLGPLRLDSFVLRHQSSILRQRL